MVGVAAPLLTASNPTGTAARFHYHRDRPRRLVDRAPGPPAPGGHTRDA